MEVLGCSAGWPGSNGLWEEVGLGAEGESITYEPNLCLISYEPL